MTLLAFLPIAPAALLVAGVAFVRARRAGDDDVQGLNEAAASAYETARKERMPLATVAERDGNPVSWFARSIASVEGKGDGGEQPGYIRRKQLKSYLRWARTVK